MSNNNNYHKRVQINASPVKLFEAVTNYISKWWSENYQGSAQAEGDEFTVRFGETFKTIKVTSVEKNKKVLWQCIDQHIEMPEGIAPLKNKREWVGNIITWEIEATETGSVLKHTHFGLIPEVECWGVCETGWDQTLRSLKAFLETGKGAPFEQLDKEHLDRAFEHEKRREHKSL